MKLKCELTNGSKKSYEFYINDLEYKKINDVIEEVSTLLKYAMLELLKSGVMTRSDLADGILNGKHKISIEEEDNNLRLAILKLADCIDNIEWQATCSHKDVTFPNFGKNLITRRKLIEDILNNNNETN